MKAANFAPWYAALYPQFAEIAHKHGYALAVHGSMARDFDVVAIPWRDDVSTPREVLDDILSQFAVDEIGEPTVKNHGRIAYTLSIGFGDCFADISFMPALSTQAAYPTGAGGVMFGDRCLGLAGCGHTLNWACPCTCDEEAGKTMSDGSPLRPPKVDEVSRLKAQIEGMALYVQHDGSCRANDLDYLDKAPCTCGLRSFYNPKGQEHFQHKGAGQ